VSVLDQLEKGVVMTIWTLRYLLTTRRVIAMSLLAAVPLILASVLAIARVATFNILLFQSLMVPLFLQVVVIFVTLVSATALIREEIDDNTISYLLTRPISKPTIVASKYVGYLIAVLVLLVPPLVLAYGVTQAYQGVAFGVDSDVLAGFVVATVLGSAAYGALFLLVSVVLRKPLAAGLLIGFLWESVVGSLPGAVPKLSLIYYLKSILKGMIGIGPLSGFSTDVGPGVAAAILGGVSVAFLVAAMAVFQQTEFQKKA